MQRRIGLGKIITLPHISLTKNFDEMIILCNAKS